MFVTSATRLFLHSINQLSTAPVLVSQIMFYWASLHVCVLSYPLQLPLVQKLLSLATKWKRVKRGGTANTSYCLSFQEHPCMLTVTWRPVVSWREAVSLTRVQSLLSSSSILSSFFSSTVSSSLFLLLIHRLFILLLICHFTFCRRWRMHSIDARLWRTLRLHQYTGLLPVRIQSQLLSG